MNKQQILDKLIDKYNLSIKNIKNIEHELFAYDNKYISCIDNLIYSALDCVADTFKMNIINLIEDNNLQEKYGINCISSIDVLIKDNEFKGIFARYDLNDYSEENLLKFIKEYNYS